MAKAFVYNTQLPQKLSPGFQFRVDVLLTGDDVPDGRELIQGLVQLSGTEGDVNVSNAVVQAVKDAAFEVLGLTITTGDITLPNWQRPLIS